MIDKEKDSQSNRDENINVENKLGFEIYDSADKNEMTEGKKEEARHHSHHHHHSHSHRHHSSRRKHRSGKRKKSNGKAKEALVNFILSNRKRLMQIFVAILVVICLVFLGMYLDGRAKIKNEEAAPQQTTVNNTEGSIQISIPLFSDEVVLVNTATDKYMNSEAGVSALDIYDDYKSTNKRLDMPKAVNASCKITGIPDGLTVEKAELFVSESEDFNNPLIFTTNGYDIDFKVYNLKTGTEYFYRINISLSNGAETYVGGSFVTREGPRMLSVEGVCNVRDIGGWTTSDGKVIKQGLLYRGSELDGAVEEKYTITQIGVNTMLVSLGVKTDMDLRSPSDNTYGTDALGASVEHIYYSAPMYSGIFDSAEGAEAIRKVFSDLADESNYPVYLHCTHGVDRTGTVSYLLETLLGLDEKSTMKEYQLSAMYEGYLLPDEMNMLIGRLKGMSGDTMQEKVEGYLISIGVTEAEIDSIQRIFLGE